MNFLERLFQPEIIKSESADTAHLVQLSTATLLVEMSRADFITDTSEQDAIRSLLNTHFSLSADETESLMELARAEADDMVSVQHLTRILMAQTDHKTRVNIVEMLWQVVYADDEKHHYEEHFVRQVSELLYVSHAEFIQARHKAEPTD